MRHGRPTGLFASRVNQAWWLIDKAALFARRDFTVVAVCRGDLLLHRLVVTPKWYRFPFMNERDLQMGQLWTRHGARGQGYARMAIEAVHARFAGQYESMWYLVDENNLASRRLIGRFGYSEAGRGERTAPFGLGALGRFVITRPS